MSMYSLLRNNPQPSRADMESAFEGDDLTLPRRSPIDTWDLPASTPYMHTCSTFEIEHPAKSKGILCVRLKFRQTVSMHALEFICFVPLTAEQNEGSFPSDSCQQEDRRSCMSFPSDYSELPPPHISAN